jgi:sodium/proline symporter
LLVAASALTHDLDVGARSGWSLLARSRVVVVLLGAGAVAAALYGSQEIFSRVLFAWAAMAAAFGPLLIVTIWRGPVSGRATLAAMVAGFVLSVAAYSLPAGAWKAVFERVVPIVVALAIAAAAAGGVQRSRR